MSDLIRKRLTGKEEGFTLIELLVVIVILGILMAIAVPSYMGFRDRASKAAAQANVRSALPSAEAFYQTNSTYVGMTLDELKLIDASIKLDADPTSLTATAYCIQDTVGAFPYHADQTHVIAEGACGGGTSTTTTP